MIETTPKQQATELIRQANDILIVSHKNPDGDSLGSMLSLKIALEKMGKQVSMAAPDEPGSIFKFLPLIDQIKTSIGYSKDFVMVLDTSLAEVEKLGYKKNETGKAVEIVITPKSGMFKESDVSFKKNGPKYDLVIAVDTPNLERLDKLAQPADIFYETPVINIDHHPSNERFGKVNWIELTATSTTEILVSLIEALSKDKPLMDESVATALLTGLIYDTSSFQNVNTTPKSLTIAAQLVAGGANQQEIVKNLYKTKSLETLKLWGFVLSNVKEDAQNRFLWSAVSKTDIERLGADQTALSGVIDELLKSATDLDFAMLLSEREGYTHASLRSIAKGFNVAQIAEMFAGGGHEVASAFRIKGSLSENEPEILQKIRDFQTKSQTNGSAVNKTDIVEDKIAEETVIKEDAAQKDTFQPQVEEVKKEEKEPETESDLNEIGQLEKENRDHQEGKVISSDPFDFSAAVEKTEIKKPEEKKEIDLPPPQSIEEELGLMSLQSPSGKKTEDVGGEPASAVIEPINLEDSLNPRDKTIKQTKW